MRVVEKISQGNASVETRSNERDETIRNIEIDMENMRTKVSLIKANVESQNCGEFPWKIEKWADKGRETQNGIKTSIFSDPFKSHKHGYKVCMELYPDGEGVRKGSHLTVFIHIMRGLFDDILSWPCKLHCTIDIINQHTRLVHHSHTVNYEDDPNSSSWMKLKTDRNYGFGCDFMRLDELSNIARLISCL